MVFAASTMESLGEASAGGMAGVFSTATMYPLVVVKTRLQAQRKQEAKEHLGEEAHKLADEPGAAQSKATQKKLPEHYNGPLDCLLKVATHEGLRGLYSGLASSLPRAFLTNFIFYFFYAYLKPFFRKSQTMAGNMLHGILAGIGVQLVMVPYEMVNVKVMTDKTGKTKFLDTCAKILRKDGLLGFYKGIVPSLILTLNPGITNVVRHYLTPSGMQASAGKNFWSGASSKAVASMITYPYVVAKVQMFTHEKKDHPSHTLSSTETPNCQSDENADGVSSSVTKTKEGSSVQQQQHHHDETTVAGVLGRIIKDEGVKGVYKGCEMQLGTAVLKEAILNMTRHQIEQFIMGFFVSPSMTE
mmetsp:Transcript_22087/g.43468  ORF Transcript_22087/g.43468 Transcript_22087/m.43468 type:complete len:358 (+) Transcript_22087:151-1224(+)